jgi:hypothetical protein
MSTTKRLKTAGLNEDGTSRLSVTKKKKSKSRYIIPAVIGTAALLSGFGGFGASSGGSFFSSIGKFFGLGQKTADTVGMLGSRISDSGPTITSGMAGQSAFSSVGSILSGGGSFIEGMFDKVSGMSGTQMIGLGSILNVGGNVLSSLLSDEDEILAQAHQDDLDYKYAKLDQDKEIADALIHQAQRETGVASTFMGHTNPIAAVEGLNIEQGYTPKPAASFPEFHPTGGLISQGQTS